MEEECGRLQADTLVDVVSEGNAMPEGQEEFAGSIITNSPKTSMPLSQTSSPSPYIIERVIIPKEPPSRRVICDLFHLIEQARELEHHGYKCSGRFFFHKIENLGLKTKITYKCNKFECSETKVITTEKEDSGVNNLAVLGALSTGSGFSQEEEKFATLGIQFMSHSKFQECEKAAGDVISSYTEDKINEAIMEEKRLAEEGGSVDQQGYACITAVVDGGWCKRTYGHGYNSSSGVAVVIGAATQKILFVGVRNKLCLICNAISSGKIEPKEHLCFKNWSGASTAMEADIVVEGLKYLEDFHKVRCTRLVGDGDSSTMTKVRQQVPYGRKVVKVECANHAVRRYSKALQKLSADTKSFRGREGIIGRKHLHNRTIRLATGARAAIKNHAIPFNTTATPEDVENLKKELRNGPSHVFGRHINCGSFCTRKESDPADEVIGIMEVNGLLSAVENKVNTLLTCHAGTLIYNATNNPAEQYMSQLAKTIGGKRVDHSRAGGINRRSNIAALAFQDPGQGWHAGVHREMVGVSPPTPLKKMISKRKHAHERNTAARRLRYDGTKKRKLNPAHTHIGSGGDQHYGDKAAVPDISDEEMKEQKEHFLGKLAVKQRDDKEQATLGQAENDLWTEERGIRLSSTHFKRVACRKPCTRTHNMVKGILYGDQNLRTAAMQHGIDSEPKALKVYIEEHTEEEVRVCGLFIDPTHPYLCTSPDALVGSQGLVEIKCPYSALKTKTIKEAAVKHNIGVKLNPETNELFLPESFPYYYQIQAQLAITDREWCDLFLWSPSDNKPIRVNRKREFWDRIQPLLSVFYLEVLLPEIIDSRINRGMDPRELPSVQEAIEQRDRKKAETKEKANTAGRKKAETKEKASTARRKVGKRAKK